MLSITNGIRISTYHAVYSKTMVSIEDIEAESSRLLDQMAVDWLDNRLAPDTVFKISASEGYNLETALNYMVWKGLIELPLVENTDGRVTTAVTLTHHGQERAMAALSLMKYKSTPKPSNRCPPY